jgi:GTP-binding protein EngB required for normal cell division
MNTTEQLLNLLETTLPSAWQEPVMALAAQTLHVDSPLRVTLVGGFSVGKSSLLNMLLGEKLLFTAIEEATALPTFLEYGDQRAMSLIGTDGSQLPLEAADFERVTTQAPEGAACAVLALPLAWLQDVVVIDLPGLGSVSATHHAYTLAQIQQADAILYLIEPRGPSQSDLNTLKHIRQYGKRVKVIVTRWDEVEAAIARGEKAPNLQQWATQIEQKTALKVRLATASHHGHGREEVLEFISRAKEDISQIRLSRFKAELVPALQNGLGLNTAEQQSCEIRSEESARQLHTELMQRKQALLTFKTSLYEQQQQECKKVESEGGSWADTQRRQLRQNLQLIANDLQSESDWQNFMSQGADILRTELTRLAETMSQQSVRYGELNLPPVAVEQLNLRLPSPETVDANDFLEVAKLSQLQHALMTKQQEIAAKTEQLQNIDEVDLTQEEQALREMLGHRQQVAYEPLPRIIERTKGGAGAAIGRMIGEVADIGLLFVNPAVAGSKVASLAGKGAKVINVSMNAKKVAKGVATGVKAAKAAKMGESIGKAQPVIEKLGMLEVLSLGYWGERIGGLFGEQPSEIEVVDPQARAEQERALAELDNHILQLRRELARKEDMANERQLTGWALAQNQQEQARLQADMAKVSQQLARRKQQAEAELAAQHVQTIIRHAERAQGQWIRSFDQQSASMTTLLLARVKQYWTNYVEQTLVDRMQEVDGLVAQMQAAPQEKADTLARLQQEAIALNLILKELT